LTADVYQFDPLVLVDPAECSTCGRDSCGGDCNARAKDHRVGGLRLRSLGDLAATAGDAVSWLLEGIVPAGGAFVLLAAFMKTGKSTWLYALIAALVRGSQFIGLGVMPGPVLLLAVEELDRDVVIRLRGFGVQDSDPLHIHVGPLPDSDATWKALRERIAELRPVLVVVDTLNRFWSVRDENDNAQVNREAGKWLELARETGVTVMAVVHSNKGEGEHGRSIRGASALFALADQALLLERRKGGEASQRALKVLGRYPDSPAELVLGYDGETWTALGTPEAADMDAGAAKLAGAITAEPRTFKELADETGISERMVRKLIARVDGLVVEGAGRRGDPTTVRWS
jgi:hypothetical protein